MRKAVLLVSLALCHARASLLEASTATEATTCMKSEKGVAKVTALGALTVKCPASYTLNPLDETQVFGSVECKDAVNLNTLVPGATFKKGTTAGQESLVSREALNQSVEYTFTVVQMPPAAVSVFYLCKKAASQESSPQGPSNGELQSRKAAAVAEGDCTIEIQIAAANPLGPNTCAVKGGRIDLDLRAVKQTARFSCSEGAQLNPQSATRAYDSTCKQEVDLPHGLARTKNTEYRLDLKELPKRAQQLCYLCKTASGNKLPSKGCEVHVSTAGGASRAGARGTSALRLALLAVICLCMN